MGRVPVAQPGDPDPRSREAAAGREGHVRRRMYYLSRGCGAKEAAAFPSRNGRGGGGGGGKCGGGGGGRRGGERRGCGRLAAGLARRRGVGSSAEAARGGVEADRRVRCLAWRWLADLSIRGAAAPSAPRGPRRGNAVTPRGSRGGRGHPTPAGARPLRRHKWSVMIQAGGARKQRAPGSPHPLFLFFLCSRPRIRL